MSYVTRTFKDTHGDKLHVRSSRRKTQLAVEAVQYGSVLVAQLTPRQTRELIELLQVSLGSNTGKEGG